MPLIVNLRHLEAHNVLLAGKLPAQELDIDTRDSVILVAEPLEYDLEVQKLEDSLLATGHLHLNLECQCVRCLKPFQHRLELNDWTCHLPLRGEDCVSAVNGCVDLTPLVREDILLEFPWHPVCGPDCGGLPRTSVGKSKTSGKTDTAGMDVSAWSKLNKLKL
jgi:uncharacterized metal-binding protein YceD (DUF177 family)